jgi:hypothetical protein
MPTGSRRRARATGCRRRPPSCSSPASRAPPGRARRRSAATRISQLQDLLAAAIADDLGARPDDFRAQVAAASLTAAFEVLERRDRGSSASYTTEDVAAAIDPVISFVRAGLEALPAPADP